MGVENEGTRGGPAPNVESRGALALKDRRSDIFFAAVETTRMPMIVTDPHQDDNPIIFANQAFLNMTGFEEEEILGRNCRFLQGPETDRQAIAEVREAISRQQEVSVEVLNYRKDRSSFWNALFISPVFNHDGELVYFFASQLDVSRRRDAEEALRQSQKMEAIGQLTGGIAHDFNNLLQVVVGYVDILKTALSRADLDRARMHRAVDQIREASNRATTLTAQLLAFARKQRLEGRTVNLNHLVENMSDLARRTLGEQVTIDLALASNLSNCKIDPTQAELALLNLVINARDAMPEGGTLTLTTRNRHLDEQDYDALGEVPPGDYVEIAVTDTGTGIPPDVIARVVEPFFTTKEVGKGTGLGLSMVYGFAKQSGGAVQIESVVGDGTTVRLLFPATGKEEQSAVQRGHRTVDRLGTETVLVVDDQPAVADVASAILSDFGYTVLTASSGREALEIIDGEASIDLLFSDLVMPGGINGVMLAREARRRQPRIKVLLTTGYAEASLERTDAGGSEFEVIAKPYRRLELARKVRLVLDGPTGVS